MSATVYEDQKVGYVVKDISPGVNNINYKYSILAGNTNEAFCINHAGIVTVAKPLDREKISSYILRVSVAVGNKVSNTTLTVSINDRNDDAPHFTQTVYSFDVSEARGTLLLHCSLRQVSSEWRLGWGLLIINQQMNNVCFILLRKLLQSLFKKKAARVSQRPKRPELIPLFLA